MRLGRWAAAALFATGVVGGSLAPRVPIHEPARAGGYWILAADFHVHGFPGDGALAPCCCATKPHGRGSTRSS